MSASSDEDLFRRFVENMEDYAIFVLDGAGHVLDWNRGATRILGYEEDEVLGKDLGMIFTPEDIAAGIPEQELMTAAETGRSQDERWHVRKDGSRFWAHGIIVPLLDAEGALRGFGKILCDRTDMKQRQENLRSQARALELADERKNIFLATLSHELRNPLAPLANCVDLLRKARQPPAAVAEMMDRQIARLWRLVDDLLDVTRISLGKLELHKTRVDLVRVVQQTVETMWTLAEARQRQIEVVLPSRPVRVEADAARVEQIITNLLDNAIKYTNPAGRISLELQAQGAEAVVRIRDSGIGIAQQDMAHIFDLFTQAHPRSAQSEAGLGLGLALVKDLVELHGGTVQATSAGAGQGSEFTVRLPLAAS